MTFPILASLLVRLVVLLPFQLLRLSLATPSRWTPVALSVLLHCVVAWRLAPPNTFHPRRCLSVTGMGNSGVGSARNLVTPRRPRPFGPLGARRSPPRGALST